MLTGKNGESPFKGIRELFYNDYHIIKVKKKKKGTY